MHRRLLTSFIAGLLAFNLASCETAPKGSIYLIRANNTVDVREFKEQRLSNAILCMGGGGSMGPSFSLWRHTRRALIPFIRRLKDVDEIKLEPDDVVIEGDMDPARAKVIERIPEIAKALKLPAGASLPEFTKYFEF